MSTSAFTDPLVQTLAAFVTSIGLEVVAAELPDPTFLPGLQIEHGRLLVDEARLRYPGDLLHEAGHLAVAPPARRPTMHHNVGDNAAEEMMAISWSYAAILHLNLDPDIVFHPDGYSGGSDSLLENFAAGRYLALPMLQWTGMALDAPTAAAQGRPAFPSMIAWLRPA